MLEPEGKISPCKSCGAEIVWMKTRNDKNICVDLPPLEDPLRDDVLTATVYDKSRFHTHFETCPNADEHRKARGTGSRTASAPAGDGSALARKLNVALKTLEDIASSPADGHRAVEIARAGIQAVTRA